MDSENTSSLSNKCGSLTKTKLILSPEEEYQLVVKRFKSMLDVFKDRSGPVDIGALTERFEAVFDKDFVRYSKGEDPAGYEQLLAEWLKVASQPGLEFRVFRYRQAGPGKVGFEVRFATTKQTYSIDGQFYFQNGRIYKGEVTRSLLERVPGEVWARDELLAPDITERKFGRNVRPLHSCMHGKLMGAAAGFLPAEERYQMVQVNLNYEVKNLVHATVRKHDVIRITTSDGQPYALGAYFRYEKRKLGYHRSLTLFDHEDQAVAFCETNGSGFLIHGTYPLIPGSHQYSDPKMEDVGRGIGNSNVVAFYPWFLMKGGQTSTVGPLGFLLALSGGEEGEVDFEPMYKLSCAKSGKDLLGYVSDYDNEESILCIGKMDKKDIFNGDHIGELSFAPGVDPCVALCVFACLDEVRTSKGTNFFKNASSDSP